MMSQILGIWLAPLLLPPGNKFLLTLLALGKVLGILCLFERMPVVHHPIWWNDFTFKGATTSAVGDCK